MENEQMLYFENDYSSGAHPQILTRLLESNLEPLPGYGADTYCRRAREKIAAACACPEADVHFLSGGTQTNRVVIAAMLRDVEGVVAAETGHVNAHEAGAVESTGHKILPLPHHKGKIDPEELAACLQDFYQDENHTHMVYPGMVYISHPTEYGTLYTKAEMEAIATVCGAYKIPLFLDGARLGYGLASPHTDVTLVDIARICDVFYIGGTKMGALCGEAVVFTKRNTPPHFSSFIKQQGALLAKGRLLGIQFDTLFTGDLYLRLGRHADEMAERLKTLLKKKGYRLYIDSPTNQQFVILEDSLRERLREQVVFSFWERIDPTHTVVRFATSWATKAEDLARLEEILPPCPEGTRD